MKKLFPAILMLVGIVFVAAGGYTAVRGFDAKDQVKSQLAIQQIRLGDDAKELVGGTPGALVDTAVEAEQQAQIIDKHALESTGGLRYAEMGRFATEDGNPAGTSNPEEALVGADGKPVANQLRNTAKDAAFLQTSLYTSVMAFNVGDLVIGLGAVFAALGIAIGGVGVAFEALAVPSLARRFHVQPIAATTAA